MQENAGERHPHVVTISTLTIVKVAVFLLAIGFVYLIRDIIAIFFVSLVLASIINPLASWFQSKKMKRGMAVLLVYAVIVTLLVTVITTLIPAVLTETRDLVSNSSAIWEKLLSTFGPLQDFIASHGLTEQLEQATSGASDGLGGAAVGVVSTLHGLLSGVLSMIIVFVVAFYLVVSEDALKRLFHTLAPEPYQPYLVDLFQRIEKSIGGWVRGQMILGGIVATAVYISLKILGVKYALVLALTAGVAESIPYVGPIISAIPAILIGLTESPLKGLLVGILYFVIHQTEVHILVPKVMQKVTGLHPIVSIFALLIGLKVAGLVGAILAIPVAMMIGILAGDAFRFSRSHH